MFPFKFRLHWLCVGFLIVLVFQGRRGDYGPKGGQGPNGVKGDKVWDHNTIAEYSNRTSVKHLCVLNFLPRLKWFHPLRYIIPPQGGSVPIYFSGWNGARGLERTSRWSRKQRNKGEESCTVFTICTCSYEHHILLNSLIYPLLLHLLLTWSPLNRETMACQAPGDHRGQQESLGEM